MTKEPVSKCCGAPPTVPLSEWGGPNTQCKNCLKPFIPASSPAPIGNDWRSDCCDFPVDGMQISPPPDLSKPVTCNKCKKGCKPRINFKDDDEGFVPQAESPAPEGRDVSEEPNRCCQNGYFGMSHLCAKQPAPKQETAKSDEWWMDEFCELGKAGLDYENSGALQIMRNILAEASRRATLEERERIKAHVELATLKARTVLEQLKKDGAESGPMAHKWQGIESANAKLLYFISTLGQARPTANESYSDSALTSEDGKEV